MHHYLSLLMLVLIIVLVLPRGAGRKQKNCCKNSPAPLPPPPAKPALDQHQDQDQAPKKLTADPIASDKLSQNEREQLRQVLALADDVKALESQFAAIKSRLPEPAAQDDSQSKERLRQCSIVTEQLRIAKSHVSYLMTFVMAPYLSSSSGQHIPSFSDASWAFTAGLLSLSFARARIVALS